LEEHEDAHDEDEQTQDGQAELEPSGQPTVIPTLSNQSRLRSGMVAVSTGPRAREGQIPKSTHL